MLLQDLSDHSDHYNRIVIILNPTLLGLFFQIVVAQLLNCVQLFVTSWTAACQAYPSFSISWSLLKLTSVESVMACNHLVLCRPLLLPPLIFPSIRVFSDGSRVCTT